MTLRPRRLGQHCSGLLSGFSAGRLRLPWTGVGPILDPEPMLPLHVAVQPVVHCHADHPLPGMIDGVSSARRELLPSPAVGQALAKHAAPGHASGR